MTDVALAYSPDAPIPVGNPDNDDPSLLLLFQHLKSKSLQTAKGTSEIPEKTEFDFVLHNARVFFRMGCHALGLDLLHSWSFERPFFPGPKPFSRTETPTPGASISRQNSAPSRSSTLASRARRLNRRPSFILSGSDRRASMVMDMDVEPDTTEMGDMPNGDGRNELVSSPGSRSAVDDFVLPKTSPAAQVKNPLETGPGKAATQSTIEEETEDVEETRNEAAEDAKAGTPPQSLPSKGGNLMKEFQGNSQQGAMEFDMSNFF